MLLSEAYEEHLGEAQRRGWPTKSVPEADHLGTVARPTAVAQAVLDIIGQLSAVACLDLSGENRAAVAGPSRVEFL